MPYSRAFVNWLKICIVLFLANQIFSGWILPTIINRLSVQVISIIIGGIALVLTSFLVGTAIWGIALERHPRDRLGWGLLMISPILNLMSGLLVSSLATSQGIQAVYMYLLLINLVTLGIYLSGIYLIGRPDPAGYTAISLALLMITALSSPMFSTASALYWLNIGRIVMVSGFLAVTLVKVDGLLMRVGFDTYPIWQAQ